MLKPWLKRAGAASPHRFHPFIIGFTLSALLLLAACGGRDPASGALVTPPPTEAAATILHVYPAASRVGFDAQALGGRMQVAGTYGIVGGTVTLRPEADQLRIMVYLEIDTPSVTVGNGLVDEALKLGMETDLYPRAVFQASSVEPVPVTDEEVAFTLDGTLTLHGQTQPVQMTVGPATVIDNHMESTSSMTIDLANYGISLPAAVVNSTIVLDVQLSADEAPPPAPTEMTAPD